MFDHLPTEATPFIAGPITGTLDGNFSITDLCSSFFTSGLALVSPSALLLQRKDVYKLYDGVAHVLHQQASCTTNFNELFLKKHRGHET